MAKRVTVVSEVVVVEPVDVRDLESRISTALGSITNVVTVEGVNAEEIVEPVLTEDEDPPFLRGVR